MSVSHHVLWWTLLGTIVLVVGFSGTWRDAFISPIKLLATGEFSRGEIIACVEKQRLRTNTSGHGRKTRSTSTHYYPVAESVAGFKTVGSQILGEKWCSTMIGKSVLTLEDKDSQYGRIVLFSQFWWPLAQLLVVILVPVLAVTISAKSKYVKYTSITLNSFLTITIFFLLYDVVVMRWL